MIAPLSQPLADAGTTPVVPLRDAGLARAETWIFDLDNTLYPAECNLFAQIDVRMGRFIADLFKVGPDEARRRQKGFFQAHGTTLRGLMVEHGVDPEAFLDYVHDIDVSVVAPLPTLTEALDRLPGRKLIYTNGTVAHADRVLERLGISDRFDGVFDIVASAYLPKPQEPPYHQLVERYGIAPQRAVMVEDMARNLKPAAGLGMTTIWVPTASAWAQPEQGDDHIHHVAPDLASFLAALPLD
ncbi:pyrimidine 5'-nucleotidase [Ferrovibrio sp.]|uniref:pyrimidine 5'-nucleotidase n=1 Tax=Ferrovibrio sp. TaxID=1917215 RepID=UPI00262853F8|nr:pyrimidine 5'-nucleotidase [Ferrovibrio sp.]